MLGTVRGEDCDLLLPFFEILFARHTIRVRIPLPKVGSDKLRTPVTKAGYET